MTIIEYMYFYNVYSLSGSVVVMLQVFYPSTEMVRALEPWCSTIFIDHNGMEYVLNEDKQTSFDLVKKVHNIEDEKYNDILIEFDGRFVDQQNFSYIQDISSILDNTYQELEEGSEFELGIMKFKINRIKTYEKNLIKL